MLGSWEVKIVRKISIRRLLNSVHILHLAFSIARCLLRGFYPSRPIGPCTLHVTAVFPSSNKALHQERAVPNAAGAARSVVEFVTPCASSMITGFAVLCSRLLVDPVTFAAFVAADFLR